MRSVTVGAGKPYEVLIGSGILGEAGARIRTLFPKAAKCAVVTDSNVGPLYADTLTASLAAAGFACPVFAFPAGEAQKTLATYAAVLSFLTENEITRGDLLVALGGGVAGDLCGFAAATYLRGIPFVQVPTSFLAAADASVGGKTAVDLPAGKNLAGAFHQPSLVLIDTDTFRTLPADVYADGMAETVKHGAIADAAFFAALLAGTVPETEMAEQNVRIKSRFVEADEFDKGERQKLNFGHTVGHAIEKCSHFAVTHGQAVAAGMCIVSKAAAACGLAKEDFSDTLRACLARYGLPGSLSELAARTGCGADAFSEETLLSAMLSDKKRFGGVIHIIYLEKIGQAAIASVKTEDLPAFLHAGLAEASF